MFDLNSGIQSQLEFSEDILKKYLDELADKTTDFEEINVEDSLNRILYEDIITQNDFPSANKALIDGYALSSADISSADSYNPIYLNLVEEVDITGQKLIQLSENQAAKISAGSILPDNADAVVSFDSVQVENSKIKIYKSALMGENVFKKGDDISIGQIFIAKQRKIRPQDVGGILSLGIKKIRVYKKPVVSIIPTGSELVKIDDALTANQIRETNSFILSGMLKELSCDVNVLNIIPDDSSVLLNVLKDIKDKSDLIIITGGNSAGEKDCNYKAITQLSGSKIISQGVKMRPGKQTLFAFVDNKPIIGLPGNSVSLATAFMIFVKPVLKQLSGISRAYWQERKYNTTIEAILAKDVESPMNIEDYVRVRLKELDSGKITAYPYAGKSSFVSTLVKAHGIIRLAPDCTKLYEGDKVEVHLF